MVEEILRRLGVDSQLHGVSFGHRTELGRGADVVSVNPTTGEALATIQAGTRPQYDQVVEDAQQSFQTWRSLPAPARGEIVRQIGNALRKHKADLGKLVTIEVGKILSEGEGEVQEMIDMCDFATGLSRQLYGLTIASERPQHRMFEQWHPLGVAGVLTAFNFPVAVWAWNAMVGAVCGDPILWKPSPHAPLTSLATQAIVRDVLRDNEMEGIFYLLVGEGNDQGAWIAEDDRIPLVSATGSCEMGRIVGAIVAGRLGRSLLELGGNNAIIVAPSADLDLAIRGIVFAAVGTAGQRCTTLRRLIVHNSIADDVVDRLQRAYASIAIGDPNDPNTLMGPLITETSVERMESAVAQAVQEGGQIATGGNRIDGKGYFVEPTIIRATSDMNVLRDETFAPILYVIGYDDLDEAIEIQNGVRQGLSSAIFTGGLREAEQFLSPAGSDCGIANVNIGTSGAEIGGAFGGEKDTGGGREAGSDAWKAYMRRQTCTVNYGDELPLAQGVRFDV